MTSKKLFWERSNNLHKQVTYKASRKLQIHYHGCYEIYYFVSGDVDYHVEGRVYHLTPNSLILLSPYVFHGPLVNSDVEYIRYSVYFTQEDIVAEHRALLLSAFPNGHKGSAKEEFYENTELFDLHIFFRHLFQSREESESGQTPYYPIFLEALLAQITRMCWKLSPSTAALYSSNNVSSIIDYLNEHLTEPITLDGLAKQFYISKYYMNRVFKKAVGTTVIDYLIYKRVSRAKQLILSGLTASDAAMQCGFQDYSSFYRAYTKKMGCSPRKDNGEEAYREQTISGPKTGCAGFSKDYLSKNKKGGFEPYTVEIAQRERAETEP